MNINQKLRNIDDDHEVVMGLVDYLLKTVHALKDEIKELKKKWEPD